MTISRVAYVDSSVLVRAYLSDELGHDASRDLVLRGASLIVTSALSEIELTSAIRAAGRARRILSSDRLIARMGMDFARRQVVSIAFNATSVLPRAQRLCHLHRLRTLDALHLAVALLDGPAIAGDLPLVFVTADQDQADATRREGLRVEMPAL